MNFSFRCLTAPATILVPLVTFLCFLGTANAQVQSENGVQALLAIGRSIQPL